MDPLVLKIGGSLHQSVPGLVQVIRTFPRSPILIVPGGGMFADQVRSLAVPEDASHWMAIAAMDQFGWRIASEGLPVTTSLQIPKAPQVLLPYCPLRDRDPLPHSWDITSDTIAAWVASVTDAHLVLLKSVDGLSREGVLLDRVGEAFPCPEVDTAFLPYVLSNRISCTVLNGTRPDRLRAYIQGAPVLGTRVETTF